MRIIKLSAKKIYQDGDRTLILHGLSPVLDPNIKYDVSIRDKFDIVESAITNVTLSEIYLWAKEHNFKIKGE